ncbi:MAG: GumC family protein [Pyrinomonadaceae bacterium]
MISEDNRLLPLPAGERALDRPLRELTQQKAYGSSLIETTTHLRDYMQVILKRKWLILSLVLIVTSLVTIQMYRLPSIYEAKTSVLIEEQQKSVLQTQGVIINAQSDPKFWNTQLQLLENPQLARQVVLTLDLQNNPAFLGGQAQTGIVASLRRIFKGDKAVKPTAPAVGANIPVVSGDQVAGQQLSSEELLSLEPYEDAIANGLSVEPLPLTNIVTLHYQHTDPELAQKIVNTLADVFVYNNFDRMTSGSAKASDLLAKEIADLQFKIKQGQETRFNYAKNHNLPLTTAPGANLAADRLGRISAQLLEAENARKEKQALYEGAAKASDVYSIPEIQEDKRAQALRERHDLLIEKRQELLVTYTPEWPAVKKIDEQIKKIDESLKKAPLEVISGLKTRYQSALSRENMLKQAYSEQIGVNSKQTQDELQISAITQDLETNKQYYNTLLQRYRELQITGNDRPNNVSVSSYSRVPVEPIGPQRARNIIIALLLSLAAGVGIAFLLDYLDDTLKTIEDVDRYLHLPALALIPSTHTEQRLRLRGRRASAPDEQSGTTALALINEARSPVAEAYRHLRTSLLLSSAGQPPKTVLVTSSQPSEGKTTTAVNTAVMLAQTGAEVLIVDCDLRRPRIHAHFNMPNSSGITNYLSGEKDLDALLHAYDKLPNLKVLTSGPVPPNPAELLGSDEMRRLINALGERFTHIIIDSPPAISFTDASVLSTLVDGVMLVVHSGRSSRAVVRRARQQLTDVGAHIFGVVLNNVKLESQEYYYNGYYSAYYSSTDEEGDDAPDATPAGGQR